MASVVDIGRSNSRQTIGDGAFEFNADAGDGFRHPAASPDGDSPSIEGKPAWQQSPTLKARAAAWILGADRWGEARWADLETQLGTDGAVPQPDAPSAAGSVRLVAHPVRRRSVPSNYMR